MPDMQDAIIMNLDDLLCVGACDNILLSSTIGMSIYIYIMCSCTFVCMYESIYIIQLCMATCQFNHLEHIHVRVCAHMNIYVYIYI